MVNNAGWFLLRCNLNTMFYDVENDHGQTTHQEGKPYEFLRHKILFQVR